MKYAVLTAKHVSGFCLWPSAHTDYHVGNSGNPTDVVAAFCDACRRHGIKPGLYYCSWDNHHRFGSLPPTFTPPGGTAYTTQAYRDFESAQIEELLTRCGPVCEVWIDIPDVLGHEGRQRQYNQIVELQPDAVVMMNHGFGGGSELRVDKAWPTDLLAIERQLPAAMAGHRSYQPWRHVRPSSDHEIECFIPGEVCDTLGREWFHLDEDILRSAEELIGMRLICRERRANLLLNVPPDRRGLIPEPSIRLLEKIQRGLSHEI